MPTPLEAIQQLQDDLIRKSLNGSVFLASDTADPIDEAALFDSTTGDLKAAGLPAGYTDLGYLNDSGAQLARAVTSTDVTSWQSKTPTRSDIDADTTTMQVAPQETKLATIAAYVGVDPASLDPASNGVLRIDQPSVPVQRFYRLLSIAVDETESGEVVICRFLPRAKPTSFDNLTFGKQADPVQWGITYTGYKDDTLGTTGSYIFGGAGWKARLAAMGFNTTPAAPTISSADQTALSTAGGQLVTLRGRGFTGTTAVTFAGTAATAFDVIDDSTLEVESPAHAAGSGAVVVTNGTGPSTGGPTVTYS